MKSNVISFQDLVAAGASTSEIRSALGCCLLKLSRGLYSVVRRCTRGLHRRFAAFASDLAWLEYHEQGRHTERSQRNRYHEHLDRLRILHYPHFRSQDVVCGISAAKLHRIGMFRAPDQPVSVFNPVSSTRTSELIRRRRSISEGDICELEGVRATTPGRTALDLRVILGPAASFAAMEQVLRRSMLGDDEEVIFKCGYPPDLRDQVPGSAAAVFGPPIARMARGHKVASTLAELISPLSESYAESRASFNLHMLGLHDFTQQFNIWDGNRLLTRLDFLFKSTGALRSNGVVLYVDGTEKYVEGGFDLMSKESRQHNRLLSMGYKIIRFRFDEVIEIAKFRRKLFTQAPELQGLCGRKLVL